MSERWFEDLPDHDPDDPEAVERALRRQERAARRQGDGSTGRRARRKREPIADVEHEDEPPRRTSRPPRTPRAARGGASRGRLLAVGAVGIVAIVLVWLGFAFFQPFAGDGDGDPFNVKIPRGASVGEIGDLLADKGVISNATMFELKATVTGRRADLNHGNHRFRENMSYAAALDELSKTTVTETITATLPEGLSRSEAAEVVSSTGLPGDYMKASVRAKGFKPNAYGAQGKAKSLEGFLFPATYELKPGSDAGDLVAQQLRAFTDNIASVDMKRAKKKNLTVYDVLTIASMIEREVSVPKERRKVAAVIYNRLKMGEPLFIDATIRFAVDNWSDPLTESDLAVDSPYNTRTNQGLPPGPIGSPGLDSIKAAANPANTDAWLYVVKPGTCGEHVFSSTLEEHNANVEAYQKAQEAAGGSPTKCP